MIAQVGKLRYQDHRSVLEIHKLLQQQGVCIAQRSVGHLLDRYDELVAVCMSDNQRLQTMLEQQQRVILAIDGRQPDVGHEVLWVIRECISGEILLAKTSLSATQDDLGKLLKQVKANLSVPIVAVVSDGQRSIRNAVETALPEAVHGLCHFHYLREAVKPIYEADRHAKKELKKRVRGIRAIERSVENSEDALNEVVEGYAAAVRAALTDDGCPPLVASGLRLQQRLSDIEQSVERLAQKGHYLSH